MQSKQNKTIVRPDVLLLLRRNDLPGINVYRESLSRHKRKKVKNTQKSY